MKQLCYRLWRALAAISRLALIFICGSQLGLAEYVIGAGDAVSIKVYGYQDLNVETRVADSGMISFPLLGDVNLAGQSTFDAGRNIAKLLAQRGLVTNAQVTVLLLDYKSQQVSVLGQVHKPGMYPLDSNNTLTDIIAMAGGITQTGDDRVVITHHINGETTKEEVDLRNVLEFSKNNNTGNLQKGDVIYVPKAAMFYIYGEVQRPGSFRLEPNMTVAQAISLGGGLTPRGTDSGIEVERRDRAGVSHKIDVELTDKVLKDDVIVVDERLF